MTVMTRARPPDGGKAPKRAPGAGRALKKDAAGRYILRFRPAGRGSRLLYFNLGEIPAKDAKQRAAELEAQYRGRKTGDPTLTFGDLASSFLKARAVELAPTSLGIYTRAVGILEPFFGKTRAIDLAPLEVEAFVRTRRAAGAAPKTVNIETAVLKRALRWAETNRLIDRYPFRTGEVRPLKTTPRLVYLEPQEWQKIEETAARIDPLTAPVWRFLVLTASRISEAVDLRWKSVDRFGKVVRIYQRKTKATKTLTLTAELDSLFRSLPSGAPDAPVFQSPAGEPWVIVTLQNRFLRVAGRAGLARGVHGNVSVHVLRHTAATLLRRAGVPLDRIAEVLGHRDLASTMVYAHIRTEDVTSTLETLSSALCERTVNETGPSGAPAVALSLAR